MSAYGDPWRLCCPDCGSHTLLAQSQGWRCRGCETKHTKIMDKRDNRLRSKQELAQL